MLRGAGDGAILPDQLLIVFLDGSRAMAEVLAEPSGGYALVVDPYTTMAGTTIPRKIWELRTIETAPDDRTEVHLGYSFSADGE